jgi:hypothetical protein
MPESGVPTLTYESDMLCISESAQATYGQLEKVPLPERTASYEPVPHVELVDGIVDNFGQFGLEVDDMNFGLAREGQRLFGVISFRGEGNLRQSVGLRNSYDRSMSVGIATGARVFVCDNMCFSGDSFYKLHKHTKNVHTALAEMLKKGAAACGMDFALLVEELEKLRDVELDDDKAYALLGTLYGRGGLTPTQFTAAAREWKTPSNDEFKGKDLWSWYNAANTALKKSAPHKVMDQYAQLHSFSIEMAGA